MAMNQEAAFSSDDEAGKTSIGPSEVQSSGSGLSLTPTELLPQEEAEGAADTAGAAVEHTGRTPISEDDDDTEFGIREASPKARGSAVTADRATAGIAGVTSHTSIDSYSGDPASIYDDDDDDLFEIGDQGKAGEEERPRCSFDDDSSSSGVREVSPTAKRSSSRAYRLPQLGEFSSLHR